MLQRLSRRYELYLWSTQRLGFKPRTVRAYEKPPSAHDDDWTDLVWRWWALSWFVLRAGNERQRWEDIPLRRKALQSSSPRGVLTEIGFCGNSLGLIMGEMCWDGIEQRGNETDGGYLWITGGMDPGSCGICDDVADWDLHLVDSTADVGSLWLNVRMQSSGSNLEEKTVSSHCFTSTENQQAVF